MPLGGDTFTAEVSNPVIEKFNALPVYACVMVDIVGAVILFGEMVIVLEKLALVPSDQTYLLVSVKANVIV
jgi:hypothetical protein